MIFSHPMVGLLYPQGIVARGWNLAKKVVICIRSGKCERLR